MACCRVLDKALAYLHKKGMGNYLNLFQQPIIKLKHKANQIELCFYPWLQKEDNERRKIKSFSTQDGGNKFVVYGGG